MNGCFFGYNKKQVWAIWQWRRKHRALFTIRQNVVVVSSIRQAVQRDLTLEELVG
ncbi:MAG: hypothetical protein R6U98_28055 [Pirellulaceae bacterium]